MASPIYLDHAASTPVRPEVLEAMLPYYSVRFGNASSTHRWGRETRTAVDEARERVAACLGAHPDEICFTSGGTEGDNLAVLGAWRATRASGRRAVAASPIEHKAVLGAMHECAKEGAEERVLAVDATGTVDLAAARERIGTDTAVASVMWVSNEIGTIQPIAELGEHARSVGAIFHTDAVQAFGKIGIDTRTHPYDLLTVSGHKFGAPKGVGATFIRRGVTLEPLFYGGSQDRGRRPGTENVAFTVALATAMELTLAEHEREGARLKALRDRLERAIVAAIPDTVVFGRGAARAPHILNVAVPGVDSESLLMALDLQGVACSGGSACQSGSITPSYVILALGVGHEIAAGAIRMSVGALSTDADIDRVATLFPQLALKARELASA
ncbi:MAG: cysteine desulfurase [Gemmatimonadetes bacterium]|nr:cysteine desulfurase [Gemmatimonadota bacterium]